MKVKARAAVPFAVVLVVLAAAPPASAAGGWKYQSSPDPGAYVNFLIAVTTASNTDAWAAGVYLNAPGQPCQTLIEHYNGTRWSQVSSPNPGSANDYLYGVKMTSSGSNVWAVGTYGTSSVSKTLVLHYDGSSWTQQASPSPNSELNTLASVAANSSTDAWAVGAQGAGSPFVDCSQYDRPGLTASPSAPSVSLIDTLIEHYDGTSWTTQVSTNPGTYENVLYGASATSATDAWAAGFYSDGSYYKTLVEHYDGSRWATMATPNPGPHSNALNAISADGPTDVWAVGSELNAQGYVANGLILHYNGTTWKATKLIKGTSNALYGVKATSATNVWAVGYYISGGRQLPLILHFNGTKWTAQKVNKTPIASVLYGIGATGTANAFAVGAQTAGSGEGTLVYHYA